MVCPRPLPLAPPLNLWKGGDPPQGCNAVRANVQTEVDQSQADPHGAAGADHFTKASRLIASNPTCFDADVVKKAKAYLALVGG